MMQYFFCEDLNIGSNVLSPEESRHCVKSLRLGAGDEIYVTDGAGGLYKARITKPDARKCEYEMDEQVKAEDETTPKIHMAVALTKNMNRFEWFLEKATEIGVNEITPLICRKSERTFANLGRLHGILVSAIKQSQRVWLPKLNDPESMKSLVEKKEDHKGFIAWMGEGDNRELKDTYQRGENAIILIGPEGDFTPEEVQLCLDHGYEPVMLGTHRLRTETAALVALQTVNLINQ
jgi:16S rRNA (uracil1498-N3)-methyltransferase